MLRAISPELYDFGGINVKIEMYVVRVLCFYNKIKIHKMINF